MGRTVRQREPKGIALGSHLKIASKGDDGSRAAATTAERRRPTLLESTNRRSDDMSRTVSERVIAPVAIGAIALATTFAAIGTYVGDQEQGTKEFLVVCVIIAVAAAVVFGLVVPKGLQREAAGVTALALSILGLVTVLAFWSGLTPILAGGGALLGWAGRDAARGRGTSWAAIVIGAIALVGYLAIYVTNAIL
jgi:hypothetical protein